MPDTRHREARSYHTRLGWWVMSHERSGNALIGAVALMLLASDLVYAVPRWHGSFAGWFVIGLASVALLSLASVVLRLVPYGVEPRAVARRRQLTINALGSAFILAVVVVSTFLHGNWTGLLLGLVAALSAFFALFTAYWLVRR